jgi:hypothetical protein
MERLALPPRAPLSGAVYAWIVAASLLDVAIWRISGSYIVAIVVAPFLAMAVRGIVARKRDKPHK